MTKLKKLKTAGVKLTFRDDLPEHLSGEARNAAIASKLREQPKRWALVREVLAGTAYATVSNWRADRRRPHSFDPADDGHFEFLATAQGHGYSLAGIYVRFIPKEGE